MRRKRLTIGRDKPTHLDANMGERHIVTDEPDPDVEHPLGRASPSGREYFGQTSFDFGFAFQNIPSDGDQIGFRHVGLRGAFGIVGIEAISRFNNGSSYCFLVAPPSRLIGHDTLP